jgi:hypothetical protein
MRAGIEPQWFMDGERVVGLNLSADFTAEHEWGIDRLRRTLGIDGVKVEGEDRLRYSKPCGLERRRVTNIEGVKFYKGPGFAVLICDRWRIKDLDIHVEKHGIGPAFLQQLPADLRSRMCRTDTLRAAWDGESFGVLGEHEDASKVEDLWESFKRSNVAMWVSGRVMVFGNGGLVIAHVDRVPTASAELLRAGDEDRDRLYQESEKTGIRRRLKEAGKGYFACSPAWHEGHEKSAWKVMYWLNPLHQDENNYGWFTVEDLDLWIQGRGPIPKKKVAKR